MQCKLVIWWWRSLEEARNGVAIVFTRNLDRICGRFRWSWAERTIILVWLVAHMLCVWKLRVSKYGPTNQFTTTHTSLYWSGDTMKNDLESHHFRPSLPFKINNLSTTHIKKNETNEIEKINTLNKSTRLWTFFDYWPHFKMTRKNFPKYSIIQ